MKILMIFVDMLRAINQNVCNESAPWNRLDDAFAKVGGVVYSKCYSPAPDTPRSLASIWTGTYPKMNGCNQRVKYPMYFLDNNLDNIWKLFERNQMSLNLFVEKECLDLGELPFSCKDRKDIAVFDDNDLNRFVRSVKIRDNSVTFITLNDYHRVVDDVAANSDKMDLAYNLIGSEVDLIFDSFGRDTFDFVVIFSDHGCLLSGDRGLINSGRIQTYLQIWVKDAGMDTLTRDTRMCSCMDIFPTVAFLMDDFILNRVDGLNLFTNARHPFLVIEDYFEFSVSLSQVLGWYGIIFPGLFVQTDYSGIWHSEGNVIDIEPALKKTFETILCNYATDYKKNTKLQGRLNAHKQITEEIKKHPINHYSNGEKRTLLR